MLNLQKSAFAASRLSSLNDFQETTDNFSLMNNLLNFDEHRKECESFLDTIRDRDWLDLIDFKEEQSAFFEDFSHPVKDSERKIKHNKIERARRLFIDAKIRELGFLLPKQNEAYHELAKDIKHNKGGILRASVTFVKILKSDQLKKQRLEEICRLQHEQLGAVMEKIREYEAEMRSYQIPVKEFFIEDPPDYGDVFIPTPVPILTKKKIKKEKEQFKSSDVQVQCDDDADDMEMVSAKDPMLSSIGAENPKMWRTLSSESIDDADTLVYFKPRKPKYMKKEPRKTRKKPSPVRPCVPEVYAPPPPRIPVVSRPVCAARQARLRSPALLPDTGSIIFPLPHEIKQLPKLGSASSVSSFYSSSSEDEPISPNNVTLLSPDERRAARAAPAPVQLSVIKKLSVQPRDTTGISIQQPPAAKSSPPPAETPPPGPDTGEAEAGGGDSGGHHGRKVILQER